MRCFLILILFTNHLFAQDVYTHSIENEKQLDFPQIRIDGSGKNPLSYYSLKLVPDVQDKQVIRYEEKIDLPLGSEAKLSGYIIAKEMLESLKIKSEGNKTSEEEIKSSLNSKDPNAQYIFLTKLAEKWRTAESAIETSELNKKISINQTQDDAGSTAAFPTGFIEVIPLDSAAFKGKEDIRFFIPLNDVNKLSLGADARIKIKKSVAVLAFKRLKNELNFPDLDEKVVEEIDRMDSALTSLCTDNCIVDQNFPNLGDFTVDIFKIVLKAGKNEKMLVGEEQNKEILNSLRGLVHSIFSGCPSMTNFLE